MNINKDNKNILNEFKSIGKNIVKIVSFNKFIFFVNGNTWYKMIKEVSEKKI